MDELYSFRDCYFETHSIEDAGKKQNDVAQEIEKTLKKLEEKEGECRVYTTPFSSSVCRMSFMPAASVLVISHRSF